MSAKATLCLGLTLLAAATVAGCGERQLAAPGDGPDTPSIVSLALPAAAVAGGGSDALNATDAAHVRLTGNPAVLLDTTIAVAGAGDRILRMPVHLPTATGTYALALELSARGQPIFRGTGEVALRRGRTVTANVTLTPVIAALVARDSLPTITALGDTTRASAAAVFATGDTVANVPLAWSDDGGGVVRTSAAGTVTALTEGVARLTATYQGLTVTLRVRVQAIVTRVAVPFDSFAVYPDSSRRLSAIARDRNGNVLTRTITWTSSNPLVAIVDTAGILHALAPGRAVITATSETQSAHIVVRVLAIPVASVLLSPPVDTLFVGDTLRLTATALSAAGQPLAGRLVLWSRSGAAGAVTVDTGGLVRAVAPGTDTVFATVEGRSGLAIVTVLQRTGPPPPPPPLGPPALGVSPVEVGFISVQGGPPPAPVQVAVSNQGGGTLSGLAVAIAYSAGQPAGWLGLALGSSTAPAGLTLTPLAAVDSLPIGVYSAAVTVSSTTAGVQPVTVFVALTVQASPPPPPPGLHLVVTPSSPVVVVSRTLPLVGSVVDSAGQPVSMPVSWSSLDPAIVTVSPAGVLTGIAHGTGRVVASAGTLTQQVVVTVLEGWRTVRSGPLSSQACGISVASVGYCWGSGGSPQAPASIPTAVQTAAQFTDIAGGAVHACGITTTGAMLCWGDNARGSLGDGGAEAFSAAPVVVSGGLSFASLAVGVRFTCALTTGGAAFCWGDNELGQLGHGVGNIARSPVAVAGGFTFGAISAGVGHACALTAAGQALCWGDGSSGQLGAGTTASSASPVAVAGATRFSAISAGDQGTCAVATTGAAFCWGNVPQLGVSSLVPVPVPGAGAVVQVALESSFGCTLAPGGAAACGGTNTHGELGNGATSSSAPLGPVSGGLSFSSLTVGQAFACGVASDGRVYCWGDNTASQLGRPAPGSSPAPVPVAEP